jgi:uncharacterized protein (DUF433 family)
VDETRLLDRIEQNPDVLGGKPVIRATPLSVEHILSMLAAGETESSLLAEYPGLVSGDIRACLLAGSIAAASPAAG